MQIGLINNLRAGRNYKAVSRILSLLRSYPQILHVETDEAGALPDAIAAAEGLDRALLRDVIGIGSGREGSTVPVVLRFRGRGTMPTSR